MKVGEWKTRDGSAIRISKMGIHHLRKSVEMLERMIAKCDALIADYDMLNGEFARSAAGDAVGEAVFQRHVLRTKKRELEVELFRRPPPEAPRSATR